MNDCIKGYAINSFADRDGEAITLEYAYQDWCNTQMTKAMNKNENHDYFMKRSKNYRNLWNPETRFIHPHNIDGSLIEILEPVGEGFQTIGLCKSNSAIYTNFVPHDLDEIIKLFGGYETYSAILNSTFEKSFNNRFI